MTSPQPDFDAAALLELPPGQLLPRVQTLFKQWGIYNQKLTVAHEGVEYGCICHDSAFVVYRLLPGAGASLGNPGWPVCLLTGEGLMDECSPPFQEEDFYASHLGLADWLTIIHQYYGEP